MIDENTAVISGYRIRRLSNETRSTVESDLASGKYDGIGFNPHRGWVGDLKDFLGTGLKLRALSLPFADKLGLDGALINCQKELELLSLSDFTGKVHIESKCLKVLGLLVKPGITLGILPALRTLNLTKANEHTLQAASVGARNLTTIYLNGGSIKSLSSLGDLSELQSVELSNLRRLDGLSPLSNCPKLEELTLYSVRTSQKLEAELARLKTLRVLRMANCGVVDDLSFLDSLKLEDFRCLRTKITARDHNLLSRIKTVYLDKYQREGF